MRHGQWDAQYFQRDGTWYALDQDGTLHEYSGPGTPPEIERCAFCGLTRAESWHAVGDEPQAVYEAMVDSHDPRVIVTHYWNGTRPSAAGIGGTP